ncbi:MAG: thioredoxin [Acidobacteriota bacterium]
MSEFVMEVNDSNFESEVIKSTAPVFVDFWAPWCGPCRMVAPVVEELAKEMAGKVKFVKVNVDDSPLTASKYGIMSIPTLLLIKGGQVVNQQVGAVPKQMLKVMIDNAL